MAAWSRGDAAALSVAGSAWRHPPSFCVAGVALSNNYRFAWQASHLWHWAGSGGALGAAWSRSDAAALCVAGGAWRHLPSFCVAGVALGNIYRRFAWQVALMALGCMALVAHLGPFGRAVTPRPFAWQACHLATSTAVLRGRHSFCFLFMITYLSRSPSSLNLGHSFDLGNLFLLL